MCVRLDKIDRFIKIHNGVRYLVLFDHGWFDKICDRIKYLICEKIGITDSINHNFSRIRTDSYNSLPFKILTFRNVIILIKSVVNKNKNNYYYNLLSEKGLYKHKSNTEYFEMNVCIL